jgi:hypothetical protein
MNNIDIQKGIVDALFSELDSLDAPGLGKRISSLMDEQPHLMGFLFNLDDDFSEDEHTFILKSAIVIRDVFISAGIPLDVIENASIEQIVEDRVELYNRLEGEERSDAETWELEAFSPVLFSFVTNQNKELGLQNQQQALIVDVIIGLYEEAAASQEHKNDKNA